MMLNKKTSSNEIIADSLGIEPIPEPEKPQQTAVVVSAPEPSEIKLDEALPHAASDYEFTRQNLKHLLEKGNQALEEAMDVASEEGKSRGYEVVSGMIKNLSDVTLAYFDLQDKARGLMNENPKTATPISSMTVKGDNTSVIMATPHDLAALIKSKQQEAKDDIISQEPSQ